MSEPHAKSQQPDTGEVVYVLGTPGSKIVKIGRTANLEKRFADIRTMSPVPLEILLVHPGSSELETALHRHFAEFRSHGEWFTFVDNPVLRIRAAIEKKPWAATRKSKREAWLAKVAAQARRRAEIRSEFQAALTEVNAIEDPQERFEAAKAAVRRHHGAMSTLM